MSTAVCVYSCGGWKNRMSVQGEYLENLIVFHDVELILF